MGVGYRVIASDDASDRLRRSRYADRAGELSIGRPMAGGNRGAHLPKCIAIDVSPGTLEKAELGSEFVQADLAVERPVLVSVDACARHLSWAVLKTVEQAGGN